MLSIIVIFGILQTELGIIATRQHLQHSSFANSLLDAKCSLKKCMTPERDALLHKIQLTVENLNQTIHFINSLHDLASKIEDLVISEEVAKLAYNAYDNFFLSYNSLIIEQQTNFSKKFLQLI